MRASPGTRSNVALYGSFLVALILAIMPIPQWSHDFRPDWVGLVLIYWCMAVPDRVSVGTGWWMGLIIDVLDGSTLGLNALAKALLAYVTVKLHLKMRMFPRWQQAAGIFALLFLNQLLVLWVRGAIGKAPDSIAYFTPSIVGMLVWPWLFVILRDLRRRFNVA